MQGRPLPALYSGGFRQGEIRRRFGLTIPPIAQRLAPICFANAEIVQHHLRTQPSRCNCYRRGAVLLEFVPLRKGKSINALLDEIVKDRNPVMRCVVCGRAVGDFHEQAARLGDEQWQKVVGRHHMCLDPKTENPETFLEVEFPDWRVPFAWPALEPFGAPDIVDEHIDAPMLVANSLGQCRHLSAVEVIDGNRYAYAAEPRN
jgi:hypothetical protein